MNTKISVITPSYNQGAYIEKTIRSVLEQNYHDIEHIIVDGGSTDETIDILKKYPHLIWISEPDKGQADALNKGLKLANGSIVGWINADDFYNPGAFRNVVKYFSMPETMWLIGNLSFHFEESGLVVQDISPKVSHDRLLKDPDIVRQQPAFFRKDLLESVRGWNPDYFMAMDYDLWVRLSRIAPPSMVRENWASFRIHSQQKTTLKNILRQSREIESIQKREGAPRHLRLKMMTKKRWQWIKGRVKHVCLELGLLNKKYWNRPIWVKQRGRR